MEAIEAGARSSDGQGGGSVEEMWIGTDEVDALRAYPPEWEALITAIRG